MPEIRQNAFGGRATIPLAAMGPSKGKFCRKLGYLTVSAPQIP